VSAATARAVLAYLPILPGRAGPPAAGWRAVDRCGMLADRPASIREDSMPSTSDPSLEVITLGGGCFWCIEAVYLEVEGVVRVESGYAGGHVPDPTYEAVCSGETGHAEVVQLTFDRNRIRLEDILAIFFTVHDPTTLNRQGHDVGTQYRSAIYYGDEAQGEVVRRFVDEVAREGIFKDPIVTEIKPLERFWRAEDYHQRYFENHPHQGYCAMVVAPKVEKFRKVHAALRRK
jgi:methionine-S-sulfoxide reductase